MAAVLKLYVRSRLLLGRVCLHVVNDPWQATKYLCMSVFVEFIVLFMFPQPAAWIPPWTPAAVVWTAPPPICKTKHRGGSVTAKPGVPWGQRDRLMVLLFRLYSHL